MQRFQRVLLYLESGHCDDASRQAVEDLVRRNDAELTVVSAVDDPSRLRGFWSGTDPEEVVAEEETERRLTLDATASSFDVPVKTAVDRGIPAISIIRRVLRGDADLVITVDSESPPASNTRRLLRKCPCPVWVIRPEATTVDPGLRVVAAVNPAPDEAELNLLILQLASSMVERAGGVLHVVHAWEMIGGATKSGRNLSGRFNVTYDEMLVQARSHRADALDALLGQLRRYEIDRQVHLVNGTPETLIPEILHDERADVLVMGTLARTGISGLLIGNTAERVLTAAPCSLMAVKPPGFVSPIGAVD